MAEEVCKWASFGDELAEGVVGVLRDGVAALVKIAGDVADVVVTWNIKLLSGGVRSGGVGDGDELRCICRSLARSGRTDPHQSDCGSPHREA